MKGEFQKRLEKMKKDADYNDDYYPLEMESWVEEAKKEIYKTFYRGTSMDTRKALHKWFGKDDPKSPHVYSELELKKMAYGLPINVKEPSKTE